MSDTPRVDVVFGNWLLGKISASELHQSMRQFEKEHGAELKIVKERQVEEIAKLVDEKAVRDAEAYRQGLKNAVVKFSRIANIITLCPPGGIFNHEKIVLEAESGAIEAGKLLETITA